MEPSGGKMDKSLEQQAAELLSKCDSEATTSAEIDQILKDHAECIDADSEECELCESLDFDILAQLAFNPVLNSEQQALVLDRTLNFQDRIEGVLDSFAANPNIADSVKPYILDLDLTSTLADFSDFTYTLRGLYEKISKNPRFSEAELTQFREDANEGWDVGL